METKWRANNLALEILKSMLWKVWPLVSDGSHRQSNEYLGLKFWCSSSFTHPLETNLHLWTAPILPRSQLWDCECARPPRGFCRRESMTLTLGSLRFRSTAPPRVQGNRRGHQDTASHQLHPATNSKTCEKHFCPPCQAIVESEIIVFFAVPHSQKTVSNVRRRSCRLVKQERARWPANGTKREHENKTNKTWGRPWPPWLKCRIVNGKFTTALRSTGMRYHCEGSISTFSPSSGTDKENKKKRTDLTSHLVQSGWAFQKRRRCETATRDRNLVLTWYVRALSTQAMWKTQVHGNRMPALSVMGDSQIEHCGSYKRPSKICQKLHSEQNLIARTW